MVAVDLICDDEATHARSSAIFSGVHLFGPRKNVIEKGGDVLRYSVALHERPILGTPVIVGLLLGQTGDKNVHVALVSDPLQSPEHVTAVVRPDLELVLVPLMLFLEVVQQALTQLSQAVDGTPFVAAFFELRGLHDLRDADERELTCLGVVLAVPTRERHEVDVARAEGFQSALTRNDNTRPEVLLVVHARCGLAPTVMCIEQGLSRLQLGDVFGRKNWKCHWLSRFCPFRLEEIGLV